MLKSVVLIAGDGGFMVNGSEMITAVQEDAPVTVLLFDDGGYGILKYYQEAAYGRQAAVDLKNPDFVTMAKSMGFESEKVTSAEEFEKGLSGALASGKPYMVVVDIRNLGLLTLKIPINLSALSVHTANSMKDWLWIGSRESETNGCQLF